MRRWAILVTIVGLMLMDGVARAAPSLSDSLTGAAKLDYDAGKLLFADGDFTGAEIKFHAAYDLSHDPRLLWNMAACEKNLRHYARAARLVNEYVGGPDSAAMLSAQDRDDAKQLLDALQAFVVKLTIVVSQSGAEIEVDDVKVGTSPLDRPIIVDLGPRKIVAKKVGFKDTTKSIVVGASADDKVELTLALDVHEGTLTVTMLPSARVSLDGVHVGAGGYRGKIKSGGHTLRVEASGMQAFQQEITIEDDQSRNIDVPLTPIIETGPKPPSYKGFYGRFSTPFWFGFGGNYVPPAGVAGTTVNDGMFGLANLKLALGAAFGWFRVEGVAMGSFGGRFNGGFKDASGTQQITVTYPMLSGFFGVGARATSEHKIIRFTGGVALGAGPHQIPDSTVIQTTACNNGGCSQNGGNSKFSPGWASFAMAGDVGILLTNGSPMGKFWLGIDWYLDFPPDVTVGPLGNTISPQYQTNGGATVIHGPQFFIGPALGVDFGH